jgi:poly(ADP-ribose) glycohydrolase
MGLQRRAFSTPRTTHIVAAMPTSIDDLEAHRGRVAGYALRLDGLRTLAAREAGFGAVLRERIMPAVLRYAEGLEAAPEPHSAGASATTTISRATVAGCLARMLLGSLPRRAGDLCEVDAGPLLAASAPQELAKLRCVLQYFDRIAEAPPRGTLTIRRIAGAAHAWERDESPLLALEVRPSGAIEDAEGHVQVDFANRYLGGGVLSGGCVQEEIRFAVSPELLAGLVVSPRMEALEAIVLHGAERFSTTRGYAGSLRYGGDFADPCARADDGTPDVTVCAIDAIDYRRTGKATQYSEGAIRRELDKARTGFTRDAQARPIASGNWGCGVFLGDPAQKAVIQWLAASAEGRALRYYTFGDARVGDLAGFAARAVAKLGTVAAVARRLLAAGPVGLALYEHLTA